VNIAIPLTILSYLVVLYAFVLFFLTILQRKFLFQTYPMIRPPPISERFEQSHFLLTTADGEKLDAMWLTTETSQCATILYLHGNATNLRCRASRIQALAELGFSILAVDWRGYGESTGAPSQAGLQLDAEAALDWLRRRTELSRVVVFAESIGTGVAVELAAKHKVGALVLEAPYFSAVDLVRTYLPFFPVQALMLDPFRSDLWIGKIRTNLLIQHGRRDRTVPFRQGERLYTIAPPPKRLVAYPQGGHNDLPEEHNSYRDLKKFVIECVSPRSCGQL
jgi:fermentation-respiration switch protein FrsA (DUF1100 family)